MLAVPDLSDPAFPWANRVATPYIVGPDIVNDDLRAMIIADLHLTLETPLADSLPVVLQRLCDLITEHAITALFVLGDLIEETNYSCMQHADLTLAALDSLSVPVFILPGNHDRTVYNAKPWAEKWQFTNIRIIDELMICLVDENPPPGHYPRIFMTHDGGNAYRVRSAAKQYCLALRNVFAPIVNPEDYFVMAHVHSQVRFEDQRSACVGRFSSSQSEFTYVLLEKNQGFRFQFKAIGRPDGEGGEC
jgi:DNA repair exonuclease SbcCD nuclease subunit